LRILAVLLALAQCAHAADDPLTLEGRIPLPGVEGRIDHLAVDLATRRLFVAALGNDTVEVVDLREGKRVRSLTGLKEPQGIVFMPETGQLAVANGGDGVCTVYDGSTLEPVQRIDFRDDADNLRYAAASRTLFVAYGSGAIGVVDAKLARSGDIPLPGHPEAFALTAAGDRLFVNVPAARAVVVADVAARKVVDTWKLGGARSNFPMALDEAAHLLLVGTRAPAQLLGLDTRSGKIALTVPLDGDPDDIFLDAPRRRVYVACGAGSLAVLERPADGAYRLAKKIATAPGARTCLFVPELDRLFLAVPHRGAQEAAVWTYAVK